MRHGCSRVRSRLSRGGDDGTTLVEVLVATVILGIGVVGLLSGLAFLFTSTTAHRQLADANTRAVRATEVVADPLQTSFAPCASAQAAYQSVAQAEVTSGVTVDSVEVWSAGSWRACGATPDLPLQQVTVTAPSASGDSTVTLSIVKRGEP